MKHISWVVRGCAAVAACVAAGAAMADDPLGFYVGAGAGVSTVRSDDPGYGYPAYYNDHETAWKGIIGVHPDFLPLGVEAEYIDFGEPGHDHGYYYDYDYYGLNSHPRAPVLFAVGYLPIPIPYIDFFAKAGVARLKLEVNDYLYQSCTGQSPGSCYVISDRRDLIQTKFAYGAGVESRLPFGFTVRAEYERIASPFGDPDALTVSAAWRF